MKKLSKKEKIIAREERVAKRFLHSKHPIGSFVMDTDKNIYRVIEYIGNYYILDLTSSSKPTRMMRYIPTVNYYWKFVHMKPLLLAKYFDNRGLSLVLGDEIVPRVLIPMPIERKVVKPVRKANMTKEEAYLYSARMYTYVTSFCISK